MAEPHVNTRVLASNDDGREDEGLMDIVNTRIVMRGASDRYVGVRFKLGYNQGETVPAAVVQFVCHTAGDATQDNLRIYGELATNAAALTNAVDDLSSRTLTTAYVNWSPGQWAFGEFYTTPDISDILQEIVDQGGWSANNHICIIIRGNSSSVEPSVAWAFDGDPLKAPQLLACRADQGYPLAFPGAVGAGAYAIGGKYGDVVTVTSLANSGAGTLNNALEGTTGRRNVVFRVTGNVILSGSIDVKPYCTVAGETAWGRIGTAEHKIFWRGNQGILRNMHLRIRNNGTQSVNADSANALMAKMDSPASSDERPSDIIFDRLSLSRCSDTTLSFYSDQGFTPTNWLERCTVMRSFIYNPLNDPHTNPNQAYNLMISEGTREISVDRCLFAHAWNRNPFDKGGNRTDVTNCLAHNVRHTLVTSQADKPSVSALNMVRFIEITGNDTTSSRMVMIALTNDPAGTGQNNHDIYLESIWGQPLNQDDAWVSATSYTVNDQVNHNYVNYTCLINHTSGSGGVDEPGVGGGWTSYWTVTDVWNMTAWGHGSGSGPATTSWKKSSPHSWLGVAPPVINLPDLPAHILSEAGCKFLDTGAYVSDDQDVIDEVNAGIAGNLPASGNIKGDILTAVNDLSTGAPSFPTTNGTDYIDQDWKDKMRLTRAVDHTRTHVRHPLWTDLQLWFHDLAGDILPPRINRPKPMTLGRLTGGLG